MEHIFRQWDDKFCRFTYWGVNIPMSLYLKTVGDSLREGKEDCPRQAFTEPSKDGVGSEQYTGLKDKSEKMVFVGDIIQIGIHHYKVRFYKESAKFGLGAPLNVEFKDEEGRYEESPFFPAELIPIGIVIGHIHKEGNK